jgi:hypothetical protein
MLDVVPQLTEIESPERAEFRGPWNLAARSHRLDIAPLEAEDQLGLFDGAAFGGAHAAALPLNRWRTHRTCTLSTLVF